MIVTLDANFELAGIDNWNGARNYLLFLGRRCVSGHANLLDGPVHGSGWVVHQNAVTARLFDTFLILE